MFQSLSTSKAISTKFTLYVIFIIVLFGVLANALFFHQWYTFENAKLELPPPHQMLGHTIRFTRSTLEVFPYTSQLNQILYEGRIALNIAKIDDEYVLYRVAPTHIKISVVTRLIQAQKRILLITLLLLVFLSSITYWLSKYFVKSSLGRLQRLTSYVDGLTLHTLDTQVPLEGPPHDEVRKIAETLQTTLGTIKRQTDSLKEFIANASHELKTPLMQLSSSLDVALKTNDPSHLITAKTTIGSMKSLIEKLLTIAKLECFSEYVAVPLVNISRILEEIAHDYADLFAKKNLEITTSIPPSIQQPVDPQDFTSLVTNLLDNAHKYTETGGVSVTLSHETLIIHDTGIGIKPEHLSHLRERFRQADPARSDTQSYGLGLSIVKKIIDRYGRTIAVQSTYGQGTSFIITFSNQSRNAL